MSRYAVGLCQRRRRLINRSLLTTTANAIASHPVIVLGLVAAIMMDPYVAISAQNVRTLSSGKRRASHPPTNVPSAMNIKTVSQELMASVYQQPEIAAQMAHARYTVR